jgi:hypothetical protein
MSRSDALKIFKLLSALELWAFSTKNHLPPFIDQELLESMEVLEKIILKEPT